ncbi:hypothetical protein DPSP01_005729 [Paraphaeosphaeria sporulosa]|uniref:Uncharacterized protein n=1 Tax=Paraphaeosphaeria sporulosa TaxID=1460663 RepID=A0A177CSZ6_9PLEO|nr:uncharacterized protein CC84DRAFT_479157 [Paraphaeosphaeria sporulosa]OAG10321.1 hypothetical protein CC84DRAFT_479157 [Paraphaeosphaeria sporulosa]
MDSGKGRKRPWETEDPVDTHTKRRASSALATYERPPLPQHAGHYLHDSKTLNQRRLPPLYTPTSSTAEPLTNSIRSFISPRRASESRSSSQPLFDPSQQLVAGQWLIGAQESCLRALERNLSPQLIGSAYRSRFGTEHATRAAGDVACCSSGCKGQECVHARALLNKLAAELLSLDSGVGLLLQKDHHLSAESPNPEEVPIKEVLRWALNTVSWANSKLRNHIHDSYPRSLNQSASQPDTTPNMRRGFNHPETREEQSPPARPYAPSYHSFNALGNPVVPTETGRSNPYGNEMPPMGSSPHYTASSSGSVFMSPHPNSPMQAPQPTRSTVLPSPSSMHFPGGVSLPPVSPPTAATTQTSAHSVLLQELQHQVSVKTIALQTLQREYDSLLQKLERQRTKCATLEKKFEVSDVEINSLTDEKEKLQAQVAAMEYQVEELQESKDESRRQLIANGSQYMRIMEMANRLQTQSADDKRRWDAEKSELQQRIKVLEEAMVTGTNSEHPSHSTPPSIVLAHTPGSTSSSSAETINVLRTEIGRLRIRTQSLETALHTMKEEGRSIQEAAKKLLESSCKIEQATQDALE